VWFHGISFGPENIWKCHLKGFLWKSLLETGFFKLRLKFQRLYETIMNNSYPGICFHISPFTVWKIVGLVVTQHIVYRRSLCSANALLTRGTMPLLSSNMVLKRTMALQQYFLPTVTHWRSETNQLCCIDVGSDVIAWNIELKTEMRICRPELKNTSVRLFSHRSWSKLSRRVVNKPLVR